MKTNRQNLVWQLPLILMLVLLFWPLFFMVATYFKNMDQIFAVSLNPFSWPPTFANYQTVLARFPFFTFL